MGEKPKGLIRVAGRELIYRTMKNLQKFGINEFIIVTNEKYRDLYEDFVKKHGFNAKVIVNPSPERGNGYSLHVAKGHVTGKFVLVMSDHVYEERFYELALKGEGLIADRRPKVVDVEEATKVKVKDGRVEDIGKELKSWDAIDTGFFVLDDSIFSITEKLSKEREVIELRDVIKEARVKVTFVDGLYWMDVDTPEEVKLARKIIVYSSVKGVGDGFISRHVNRKISTRISVLLVEHFTPNQLTIITFLFGIFSGLVNFFSVPLAGILYQISSILDGVDGEIARARMQTSRFGGYFDSILDRYVDFTFLLTLAYVTLREPLWWAIAALAIFSSAMVSYSTERFKGAYCADAYKAIPALRKVPGKRDERIFVTMIFTLLGWVKPLFALLAIWSTLRVAITVFLVRRGVND
ncbi:putative glucose-1-phosphate thymidylyltransferase-like protein [Pyrococcus sp. ST04]|nr:putative glucose-1-phosphate thymidylyltransferase-like protein [Pyrococcus sp. ST04]